MAVYNPPLENLPIFDASQFVEPTGGGFTQAQANLLYLKKTTPDTATAVETFSSGIKTSNIDTTIDDTTLLIGPTTATNINFGNITTNTSFNGYAYFNDFSPNCAITANLDDEMPNKLLMDKSVAQSGSTQLFLNYSASQTGIYKSLETEIIVTTLTNVTTLQSGTRLISSFLTPVGYPNVTRIPRGIWKLTQVAIPSAKSGTLYYFFKVYKGQIGSFTQLGTSSSYSNDIVEGNGIYYAELYLAQQTILATDRILIEIYTIGTGVGPTDLLLSAYQGTLGSPLSYITCPLQTSSSINYLSGTIDATLVTNGSVAFSTAFATIPKIILTANSGSTTSVTVCGLSTKSTSGFSWVSSYLGATIDWFAIQ